MIIVYYPCFNCIDRKLKYICEYIDNMSPVSLYRTSSLIKDGHGFASHRHELTFDNGITSLREWCDGQDPNYKAYDRIKFIAIAFCMSSICSYDHEIMQLIDTGGVPCVYQTSQRNWVTIKMLYRYLRGCLLRFKIQRRPGTSSQLWWPLSRIQDRNAINTLISDLRAMAFRVAPPLPPPPP